MRFYAPASQRARPDASESAVGAVSIRGLSSRGEGALSHRLLPVNPARSRTVPDSIGE